MASALVGRLRRDLITVAQRRRPATPDGADITAAVGGTVIYDRQIFSTEDSLTVESITSAGSLRLASIGLAAETVS